MQTGKSGSQDILPLRCVLVSCIWMPETFRTCALCARVRRLPATQSPKVATITIVRPANPARVCRSTCKSRMYACVT